MAKERVATRILDGLKGFTAIIAKFIGVKVSAVQKWEQDRQEPNAMACRFMDEIQRNPEYWRGRLKESVRLKETS